MEWLNIHLPVLRSPEYISAEPVSRATWLNVLGYCCQQENRGTIPGAALWKDRQWQQSCGVTHDEVLASSPLILFVADDAVVWKYPIEKELEVKAKREAGSRGGLAKAKHSQKQNPSCATSTLTSSANGCAPTEGEGKEKGNRKEKGKKATGAELVFPVELDTSEFHQAWQDYVDYRSRRKLSVLLPESVSRQFTKMAGWGLRSAIYQINETIANGWQGVFDPKPGSKTPFSKPVHVPRYDNPTDIAVAAALAANQ